jgi:hypothetical protein
MVNNDTRFGPQDTRPRDHARVESNQGVGHEPARIDGQQNHAEGHDHGGHAGHTWMMMLMCAPMLIIAIALVATGAAGAGTIFIAIGCALMMALMMRGMGGDGGGGTK